MTHRSLTITVSGATASGKTVLANKIVHLLRDNGIGDVVEFEDLEHTQDHLDRMVDMAPRILADATITVNMHQLARGFVRPPFTTSEIGNQHIREGRAVQDKVPDGEEEAARLRAWVHYIGGNFSGSSEAVHDALAGSPAPEGF